MIVQVVILLIAVLGLVAAVGKYGSDQKELGKQEVMEEVRREKEKLLQERLVHEAGMRLFAQTLSKDYLTFAQQLKGRTGKEKDEILQAIRNNPTLRLQCGDADFLRRFNAPPRSGSEVSGEKPAASTGNGSVSRGPDPAAKDGARKREPYKR